MKPLPEPRATIEGTSELLAAGVVSAVEVVEGCLERIGKLELEVRAWESVDRDGALDRAEALDRDFAAGKELGPLHGIPVGIKDIIDVAGLPTSAGARFWDGGRFAEKDAALVASLRKAGAIILGKTVTTPYAWIDPPTTRNPWNLDRTPGGSSSGSAAAVAAGMCLGAFGTQTGGSIIRPAAYCGVAGFKPSRTSISTRGIVPFAPSLDTPGPFARSVEGLRRLARAVALHDRFPTVPDRPAFRLGRLRGLFDELAEPAMTRAVDEAAARLKEAGARLVEVELPRGFEDIRRAHRVVMAAEAAVQHGTRFAELPEDYPPRIAELITEGLPILASDYIRANSLRASMYQHFFFLCFGVNNLDWSHSTGEAIDAFLMPAALGPAPGPETTGDPVFNSPWTFLDSPAVALPIGISDDEMPLAIQLVHADDGGKLLDVAAWCEQVFRDRTPRD
jgi:aspartyl-tRNA(Asn)/glutamyl-tRNA(Gln) amidotransferase subunit A